MTPFSIVEGVWSDCQQHGWNLIDGYVVDLVDEFFIWQGREGERLREPLNVYTVVETCGVQDMSPRHSACRQSVRCSSDDSIYSSRKLQIRRP